MKPIHLIIAGLNSFREQQEIDFTSLCEAGVFGIFGPTGSGKSTVLDAITLALYGKVERAKGATSGIINQNEEKAYVGFTFEIGDRKFSAERSYKKSSDGSINQQSCRLMEFMEDEPQVIADKKREVDEKIQGILGLTSEDFTRAVVLPQGKFQEFLTLQGAERRKMLQRIFNLEKYGEQLIQNIKNRLNHTKINEEKIRGRQSELGDASPEAIEHLTENLAQETKILQTLKTKAEEFRKREEDFKQILQLQEELAQELEIQNSLQSLQEEIRGKEERLKGAVQADYLKPFITYLKNENKLKRQRTEEAAILKAQLVLVKQAYQGAEQDLLKWQEIINTQGEKLKITLHRLEDAFIAEQKRDELQGKRELLLAEYTALNNEYQALIAEIKELDKKKTFFQNKRDDLNGAIQAKEQLLKQEEVINRQKETLQVFMDAEKGLLEFNLNKKNKEENFDAIQKKVKAYQHELEEISRRQQIKEQENHQLPRPVLEQDELNSLLMKISQWEKEVFTLEHYQTLLVNIQKQISENRDKQRLFERQLQEQVLYLNQAALQREKFVSAVNDLEILIKEKEVQSYGSLLSSRLQKDIPCPVCGSLDHPNPAPILDGSEDGIANLQNALLSHKQNLKEIEEKYRVIAQEIAALKIQNENIKKEEIQLESKARELQTALDLNVQNLPGNWQQLSLAHIKMKLAEEKEYYQNQQTLLDSYTSHKERLAKEADALSKQVNQVYVFLKQEEARAAAMGEDLEDLKEKEKKFIIERDEKLLAFKNSAQGLSAEEILNRVDLLKEAKQDVERLRSLEKEAVQQLDYYYEQLSLRQDLKAKLLQSLEVIKQEGQNSNNLISEYTSKINDITGGKKPKEAKELVLIELESINRQFNKAVENKEQTKISWEEKKGALLSADQEIEGICFRIFEGERQLNDKLAEYGFNSCEEAESSFLLPAECEKLKGEIESYRNSLLIKEKNIEALENKLAGRSITQEQWLQFSRQKITLEKELEEAQAKVHKLEGNLQTLNNNYVRWQDLERERKLLSMELDKLVLLEKLFRGNTFVEYMAEEQLISISLDASRRLGELTNYRYALEVDSEGGFIIRDDANGGLRRPVATLSGGETFLTSLALALALSGQIQLKGKYPLQFFFLDEGFGTLDSFLLETVMNSLERLHTEKMTIGIISHVPELRARISRSLVVEPALKGGRGTCLSIETA
ncbi:MAG: AAA family ATPase [Bacillota bacterium]